MTPLAHAIVRDSLAPAHKKVWRSPTPPPELVGVHCFECTEVAVLALEIGSKKARSVKWNKDETASLPADRMWIEYVLFDDTGTSARMGPLLEKTTDTTARLRTFVRPGGTEKIAAFGVDAQIPLFGHDNDVARITGSNENRGTYIEILGTTFGCLAIINTPRAFLRRERQPHKGLAKAIKAAGSHSPLNRWSEIVLDFDPSFDGETTSQTGRLSGPKAYHYCRAHLRIKNGKLEQVRGHMRGDPALGTVQSRYTLKGPRAAPCENGGA